MHRRGPQKGNSWEKRYQELCRYYECHQNTCLTHNSDASLLRWIQRQRLEYKRFKKGEKSYLTNDRIEKLEALRFEFDPVMASWKKRFNELKEYHMINGHCNVPQRYKLNPKLGR